MAFIVRPIGRTQAQEVCRRHPHASTLPNSSKYYMLLTIDGREAGLAVWGWGIVPTFTLKHLFEPGAGLEVPNYLELCRFFVHDWCPKNTASRFLATTHRLIRKHAPAVKFLYTYAAGFQGLVGHIYKAVGYDYLGTTKCDALMWIPGTGMVHRIALFHRYAKGSTEAKHWQGIFPGAKQWNGLNFRYLYWTCDKAEKARLLGFARFKLHTYPTEADLLIWTEDHEGRKERIDPAFAKTIPIVKLPTRRKFSQRNAR
jgi:hypothetical protein